MNNKEYKLMQYLSIMVKKIDKMKTKGITLSSNNYSAMLMTNDYNIIDDIDGFYHSLAIEDCIDYVNSIKNNGFDYILIDFQSSAMLLDDFMKSDYVVKTNNGILNLDLNILEKNIIRIDPTKAIVLF